jgi:PAS domain S-box-containing protein
MPDPELNPQESELEALLSSADPSVVLDVLLGSIPAGVAIARAPDGKVLRFSAYAAQLVGRPRSEVEGRRIADLVEAIPAFDAAGRPLALHEWPLSRALHGETVTGFEFWVVAPDGASIPLIARAAPIHNARGELIGAISSVSRFKIATDYELYLDLEQRVSKTKFVTGDRSLVEVIAASMQSLLSKSSEAVITLDPSDRIVLFNPAAERLFGVSAAEALGGSISRFIPEDRREAHVQFVRDYRQTGKSIRRMGESRHVSGLRADGTAFPMEAWISRVRLRDEVFVTVVLQDTSERELVEDARLKTLIAGEAEHRARNALGVVQALVKTTEADTKEDLKQALRGRIAAFSRSFSLLMKCAWQGVGLSELVDIELAACAAPDQVRTGGPKVRIAPQGVQALSLVLHELATNALKYGALSQKGGVVDVSWKIAPGLKLELAWRETGGPAIAVPPSRQGFGSVLLNDMLVKQLNGDLSLDWRPEGLFALITIPPPLFDGDDAAP